MKEKKYKMNGYDALVYKTDKYTSLLASFMFEIDYTKENITLCDYLADYMLNTNKKYKRKHELQKMIRTYYGMTISITNFNVGSKLFVEVGFLFLDPLLVKDDYLSDAIDFVHNYIFNPNFIDGRLDEYQKNESKKTLINYMGSHLSNPDVKANNEYRKSIGKNTYITTDVFDSKEEYEDLLNSFTDEDVIKMYHKVFDESFVGCVLMGNYSDDALKQMKELFTFKKVRELDASYFEKLDFNLDNRDITIEDDSVNQSTLIVTYSINDYKEEDYFKYLAIKLALNYVGMVLHKVLREELKLVYNASANFNRRSGYMNIRAYIDKDNKDKTIEGIDDILNRFKNVDYIKDLLLRGKKEVDLDAYTLDESESRLFDRTIQTKYKWKLPIEEQTKLFHSLTEQDIIDAINRLKKEEIFFYKGVKE